MPNEDLNNPILENRVSCRCYIFAKVSSKKHNTGTLG